MDERADSLHPNPWDEFATEFASFVARREQQDLERDPILMEMLPLLGDIRGKRVLDACCGSWSGSLVFSYLVLGLIEVQSHDPGPVSGPTSG